MLNTFPSLVRFCFAIIAVGAVTTSALQSAQGAEPEVTEADLPRVPATPPDKALSTFKVKPGFKIELVAAEPMVVDPIALCFDENSRMIRGGNARLLRAAR